jgi:hypothetical protein
MPAVRVALSEDAYRGRKAPVGRRDAGQLDTDRVVELAGDVVDGVAVASQELVDGVPERTRVDGPAPGRYSGNVCRGEDLSWRCGS